jgi:hypothetical protein
MSEFTDQLERELRAAAGRRVRLEAARIPWPRGGALAVALSAVLCAGVLLAATQIHGNPSRLLLPSSPAVPSVDPQIVSSFRAFRRPRVASDAVPGGLRFEVCGGEGPGNYSWCNVVRAGEQAPPPDKVSRSRLTIFGHPHVLELSQSRRIPLPGKLGSIWLIPSGGWLCALLDGPRWTRYSVRMRCGTIDLIHRRPPIDFPGFFFGPTAHGIMMAAEPDEITRAVITYPGGIETGILRGGALVACIGQGPYKLAQTTARGVRLRPISVGALGPFRSVSCPELGLSTR